MPRGWAPTYPILTGSEPQERGDAVLEKLQEPPIGPGQHPTPLARNTPPGD